MNLTAGQTVTASQHGCPPVRGTYTGPSDLPGFVNVQHVTGTGRTVVGRFPLTRTVAV